MDIRKEIRQINCYAGQNRPAWIVIHETDNYKKGAGALKHAEAHRNGNLSTSVHWYVDDKVAVQTLYYSDGAYAVGKQYGTPLVPGVTNTNSINIEICVNPDSDYDTARANCIELVRQIMAELEIPADHVIRHYDAKRKHCPRKMLDQPQLWTDFKAALNQPTYATGWHHDSNGWWYADTPHTYYKSCWQVINHHKYYFNQDGYALTDWHQIDGKWYYFEPAAGHPLECALYVTDASGVQGPGEF